MSIFTSVKKFYGNISAKQFVLAGVFMLALAGAIGGGFASKQSSTAATIRDCDTNSIDYKDLNGGCGAADANEFILDAKGNNPNDLQNIYNRFGLATAEYDRFKTTAKAGVAYKTSGKVVVDGVTVIENAWSIGRKKFDYSTAYPSINGKTYYKSMHKDVLGQNLPVMVMFDDDGNVEFTVINACGNPVDGDKIQSRAECNALNMKPVQNKKNAYEFTTTATKYGLAKFFEFEYFYNDGSGDKSFAKTKSGSEVVTKTFEKSATVTVRVTITLPNGNKKVIVDVLHCSKKVGVVKEEVLKVCDALVATSSDNKTFRFTLKTKQSDGVTVKSADFNLDDKTTVTGIKPVGGVIYRDYTFTDYVKHTVTATKVTFVVEGKDVVVVTPEGKCRASVTRDKAPECKPGIPEGDERCKDYCKPGVPVGSPECEPELPKTGAGSVAGLFAGVAAAGTIGHRVYMSRRARSSE